MSDQFVAKCRITAVTKTNSAFRNGGKEPEVDAVMIKLQPVYGEGEDDSNAQWSKWTPSGEIQLSITNPAIFPMLRNGRLFMVTFSAVDAPPQS